jgi:acetylornithine deacetylase/succinyl-diaminopimelate desuccinylase family protein
VTDPTRGTIGDAAEAAAAAVDPDEVLTIARALLAARSENPGGSEEEAAGVAADVLASIGAQTEVVRGDAGRPNVIGSLGPEGGATLAWNGHLDTVPAGSLDTWSVDPFAGTVAGGRLVGRGACDMKGPIAAALAAGAALGRAGVELRGRLTYHLVSDEEVGGLHGTKILLERGMLTQDAAIVGEPTELRIGLAERGGAWITATAFGRAAHGSQPEKGLNAITSLSRFMLRLDEGLPDLEHPLCGRPTINVALIEGGSAPNMVPDRCVADIDRRTVPGEDEPDKVLAPLRRIAEEVAEAHEGSKIDLAIREWVAAAEAPVDSDIALTAAAATQAELGSSTSPVGFTGITDARFYINGARIPTVIWGPGSLSVAHSPDESIGTDELVVAARACVRTIAGFLGAG